MENDKKLTEFNEGGSHEQNPNGGIAQGVGANGKPNKVEEGETKFKLNGKDFVFSKRLNMHTSFINKFYLPNYTKNKSFAEASKAIEKAFEDKNDNASNSTKEELFNRLSSAQELAKVQKQARAAGLSVEEFIAQQEREVADKAIQQAEADAEAKLKGEEGQQGQQGQPIQQSEGNPEQFMAPNENAFGLGGNISNEAIAMGGATATTLLSQMKAAGEQTEHKSVIGGAAKGMLTGAAGGAMVGSTFGPAGAAVGAGVGAVVGLGTGIAGTITGNVKADRLNRMQQEEVDATRLSAGLETTNTMAYGGSLNNSTKWPPDTYDVPTIDQLQGGKSFSMFGDIKNKPITKEDKIPFDYKNFNTLHKGNSMSDSFNKTLNTAREFYNEKATQGMLTINNKPEAATNKLTANQVKGERGEYDSTKDTAGDSSKKEDDKTNNVLGIAGLASSLAPFIGNMAESSKYTKPDNNIIATAGRTYIPEFADEASRMNVINDSYSGINDSIANATAGDLGAYRANLLGANVSKTNAKMDAYNSIENINRGERSALNSDYARATQENVAARNLEVDLNKQDLAAYDAARTAHRVAAYEGLGKLGETIFKLSQYDGISSYNKFGKKKKI